MTKNILKNNTCLLGEFEPRKIKDALENENWIRAMNEEINQIERNKTGTLVHRPKNKNVIGKKWVFRNKLNEKGEVIRNNARLVCKGYAQEEGVEYEEKFAHVATLEGIRILLSYSPYKGFKVYQIDVKSIFMNEIL